MIVVMACVSQRAGGISCILAYSSLILPEPAPIINKSSYVMLFAVLLVIVNFVGATIIDKVGRRPLLIISQLGMGLITFEFVVYFYLEKIGVNMSAFVWLPYSCFILFAMTFAIGIGFVPVVLLGEMFPVNIRSHCSAIASITLASCSFITNKIFLLISHRYGYHIMFLVFTVINFSGVVYSYVYAIETKGKTFQEIQEILNDEIKQGKSKKHVLNTIWCNYIYILLYKDVIFIAIKNNSKPHILLKV